MQGNLKKNFFFKLRFSKYSFRNKTRVSNGFNPDQAQHCVGPGLGPNCLQRLSADNASRQRATIVRPIKH